MAGWADIVARVAPERNPIDKTSHSMPTRSIMTIAILAYLESLVHLPSRFQRVPEVLKHERRLKSLTGPTGTQNA